jgi:uncharacterized delta-60 repeat protein
VRRLLALVVLLVVTLAPPAGAAGGQRDPGFGHDGSVVRTNLGRAEAVAVAPDGRILTVGVMPDGRWVFARYRADGTPDETYGTDGFRRYAAAGRPSDLAVDAAGGAVAIGDSAIVRVLPTGALDTTFGGDGVIASAFDVVPGVGFAGMRPIVGYRNGSVVRYTEAGTVDPAFGPYDLPNDAALGAIAVAPDGSVLAAGAVQTFEYTYIDNRLFLGRTTADGAPDPTFGLGGYVRDDRYFLPTVAAFTPDGGFVLQLDPAQGLQRRWPDGQLDTAWGWAGVAGGPDDFGTSLALAVGADGSVYLSNDGEVVAISRFDPAGQRDTAFGTCGYAIADPGPHADFTLDMATAPDGSVIVAGLSTLTLPNGVGADVQFVSRIEVDERPALPPPTALGYWTVTGDGRVGTAGTACHHGDARDIRLNQPTLGMARSATGEGYWLVARDGGIFSFGDARFFGSTGNLRLNAPVVGMAATPTGRGYWLVAEDGGIFTFGDAAFFGSTGAMRLNQPVFAMAPTPTGKGYWLVARDGGIFTFGDAVFHGSAGDEGLTSPVVSITPTSTGEGYWLTTAGGRVLSYGDAVVSPYDTTVRPVGNVQLLYWNRRSEQPAVGLAVR